LAISNSYRFSIVTAFAASHPARSTTFAGGTLPA